MPRTTLHTVGRRPTRIIRAWTCCGLCLAVLASAASAQDANAAPKTGPKPTAAQPAGKDKPKTSKVAAKKPTANDKRKTAAGKQPATQAKRNTPANKQPAAGDNAKAKTIAPKAPVVKIKADDATWAEANRRRAERKRKRANPFTMDPNAKWVCDRNTIALDPVWRGAKSLSFTFEIRNEGTADLKIKAKGG
ncbi:MAG: hypothetical protein ACE5EX_09495 [Phycisphaerae bacterium]